MPVPVTPLLAALALSGKRESVLVEAGAGRPTRVAFHGADAEAKRSASHRAEA